MAGAKSTDMNVYLIPGQGADQRLFDSLELGEGYNTIHIQYSMPEKGMSMRDYAKELALQIDTSQPFILIGVSLGGMLSVEMNEFLNPERTIIISSAKRRKELPFRYRFQKVIPLYKIVPPALSKRGAMVLQPIVEPDSKLHRNTFNSMLKDKDRQFFKRTIAMILEWNRKEYSGHIVHVHGDSDHTIPVKNVKCDYLVKDGSHMMTLTRGAEISRIVLEILEEN
jgi:pimeloyl-ACP methyl ester carboxylesterase